MPGNDFTINKIAVNTAQKMKFFIKDFVCKCDQIRGFLRFWSHLLKKSLMENFIFLCSAMSVSAHNTELIHGSCL